MLYGIKPVVIAIVVQALWRLGRSAVRSPLLIAVALATTGVTLGSAVLHFMLGETIAASQLFLSVLVPSLALNMLLAYPIYGLCARFLPPHVGIRREVSPAV
jgi:chromate transport protein ChrA